MYLYDKLRFLFIYYKYNIDDQREVSQLSDAWFPEGVFSPLRHQLLLATCQEL